MQPYLVTYLHDHLAGSQFAVELLKTLHEQYPADLGAFAQELLTDVRQDQATLQSIIDRVGEGHFDVFQISGWLTEKVSRLKLQDDGAVMGIGTVEAVETLAIGIQGKIALWRSLNALEAGDVRISGYGYPLLIKRAEEQFARVEEQRIAVVRRALFPTAAPVDLQPMPARTAPPPSA